MEQARCIPAQTVFLRCERLLSDVHTLVADGGLLVRAGVVVDVATDAAAARRLAATADECRDLGPGWVTPGLVDPHAHLELTAVGTLSAEGGFGTWIGRVLQARAAASPEQLVAGVWRGARQLLESGTTAVGDIDTTGAGAHGACGSSLPTLVYREVLDAQDPARTAAALDGVSRPLDPPPALGEGLAPHAPFTVGPELLRRLGELAPRRGRVTVHWSETEAEVEYLVRGSGPLAALLGPSPRRSGLDLLDAAHLLGPGTSLVHGNHPEPGEAERLRRAGVVLVHCPGTHAHFGRAPFPYEHYRREGVRVALGTDSLASNDRLDMRREMASFTRAFPEVRPSEVWEMATVAGAAAMGYEGRLGRLSRGHRADLCVWALDEADRGSGLEALTRGCVAVRSVWIGGRSIDEPSDSGAHAVPRDDR